MLDQMNHNSLAVTGTPSLVTGALTVDTDQALSFNGTTNSASAADSTSLSITGSLSIELFLRFTSLPGSTLDIVRKTGSYAVQVDSSGHVLFKITNSGTTTLTSNVTLTTNRWYHLVCVYNGNYAGVTQFGKTSIGSSSAQVADDGLNSKAVSKFTLLESALLTSATLSLEYVDELWPVQMCAVVYSDLSGAPNALVTHSEAQTLFSPYPAWRAWTPITFPLATAVVPAGDYHIGYVSDTIYGGPGGSKPVLVIGREVSGGTTSYSADSPTGPSNPFGTPSSTTVDVLAAYCSYTAIARTGNEGKMLIYIDGARNTSTAYAGGIADTSNTLDVCPAVAAQVDEISIWNKPLTDVQIATHYTAH